MNWKLFGWITLIFTIAGFFWRYNWYKVILAVIAREKMIEFAKTIHSAQVIGSPGSGKTLLLSVIARGITEGIKKTGFVSNIPDATFISYNDLNLNEAVPELENFNIPKYLFLDEINSYIEGIAFTANRKQHEGVESLFMWLRHLNIHVWASGQRINQVWVAVRDITNYVVIPRKPQKLFTFFSFWLGTLKIDYFVDGQLEHSFTILITNLDFDLYDSYWLKNLRHFRPVLGQPKKKLTELEKVIAKLNNYSDKYRVEQQNKNPKEKKEVTLEERVKVVEKTIKKGKKSYKQNFA